VDKPPDDSVLDLTPLTISIEGAGGGEGELVVTIEVVRLPA